MRRFVVAAALVMATVPTYASAAITTFGQYTQLNTGKDIVFRAAALGGFGGTLSSRTNSTAADSTITKTLFDFLVNEPGGANIAPIAADFSLSAKSTAADTVAGSTLIQGGFKGSFSFIYEGTTPLVINGLSYAAGTNLLTGVFSDATLVGQSGGSSGGIFDSSSVANLNFSNIVYTSDVVKFNNDQANDLSFTLTAVTPTFKSTAGHLGSFGATGTGSFSSDPTPSVNAATPEMATWGMMVLGFGLIGGTIRSRRVRGSVKLPVRQAAFA